MSLSLPEQFEAFSNARQSGFLKVKALKEEGKLVAGTFCTFTPLELLDAADFTPVSLCGMSAETISAGETELPKNLCPLIKSSYGFAVADKCPYTYFADLIVGETTCDGKKKMYELLGKRKQVFILHLPQGPHENALDAWTAELHRFAHYLEEHFGRALDDDRIRQAVRDRNTERQARRRLMELQKAVPPISYGLDIYKALDGAGFLFSRAAVCEHVDRLTQALETAYAHGARPVSPSARRILVTGCPIGGVLEKTVGPIEENGGVVVCFENCTGIKAMREDMDPEAPDIYREIARHYLKIGCAVMTPDQERIRLLRELIPEYQVQGIVEVDLQACTSYAVETFTIRKLAEELHIPYLAVETDYSELDLGQLSTRLEAFLEML